MFKVNNKDTRTTSGNNRKLSTLNMWMPAENVVRLDNEWRGIPSTPCCARRKIKIIYSYCFLWKFFSNFEGVFSVMFVSDTQMLLNICCFFFKNTAIFLKFDHFSAHCMNDANSFMMLGSKELCSYWCVFS